MTGTTYTNNHGCEVTAIQYLGDNLGDVLNFCRYASFIDNATLHIKNPERTFKVNLYDYVVQGALGEYYPMNKEIFENKYKKL